MVPTESSISEGQTQNMDKDKDGIVDNDMLWCRLKNWFTLRGVIIRMDPPPHRWSDDQWSGFEHQVMRHTEALVLSTWIVYTFEIDGSSVFDMTSKEIISTSRLYAVFWSTITKTSPNFLAALRMLVLPRVRSCEVVLKTSPSSLKIAEYMNMYTWNEFNRGIRVTEITRLFPQVEWDVEENGSMFAEESSPSEEDKYSSCECNNLVFAGTFDHFHFGHKTMLLQCLRLLGKTVDKRFVLALTSNSMTINKSYAAFVQTYAQRFGVLKRFFQLLETAFQHKICVDITEISDPIGTPGKDPTLDTLVITEDTVKGGELVNKARMEQDLLPMKIVKLDEVLLNGQKMSSENIRRAYSDLLHVMETTGDSKREQELLRDIFQEEHRVVVCQTGSVEQLSGSGSCCWMEPFLDQIPVWNLVKSVAVEWNKEQYLVDWCVLVRLAHKSRIGICPEDRLAVLKNYLIDIFQKMTGKSTKALGTSL